MAASPETSLDARRDAMAATIASNAAHYCDVAGRFILDGLSARLARLLAALERDLAQPLAGPFGTAGLWGRNGRGPEIDDLIRRSDLARLNGTGGEARAPPASAVHPAPSARKDRDALPVRART